MCVCVRVYVSPEAIYISVPFVALAINVIDRRGPSNKMLCQLQPKKAKVMLY